MVKVFISNIEDEYMIQMTIQITHEISSHHVGNILYIRSFDMAVSKVECIECLHIKML
jgi:hypothetical protein